MRQLFSITDQIEYEHDAVKALKKYLIQSGTDEGCIVEHYKSVFRNRECEFDVVVLDSQDRTKIKAIYEIKTITAASKHRKILLATFDAWSKLTEADVFLVYLGIYDELHIESYEELQNSRLCPVHVQHIREYIVDSFEKFYSRVKEECNDETFDCQYYFRGHADTSYSCLPGIYRESRIAHEDLMFYEAERICPSAFPNEMSTFDKLAKMQHYGLPTRLLDITKNPLVALYFACCGSEEEKKKDGQVLIFPVDKTNFVDSDSVCVLANLTKMQSDFRLKNKDLRKSLVYNIQQEKSNFNDCTLEEDVYSVICVSPKQNNDRLERQSGAFFLFGMSRKDIKILPAEFPYVPTKITIKATAKESILKELSLLGISEMALFPEVDKMMSFIKNKYS